MVAFISYSHDDMRFVDQLCQDLEENAVDYWRDKKGIQPGQYLDSTIEAALQNTSHFLVVVSNASTKSDYVRDEIAYAKDRVKHVAPLRLEECDMPLSLIRRKWIDFTEDYSKGLAELLTWLQLTALTTEELEVVILDDYVPPELTTAQLSAAHADGQLVRVIAGPGTGKSFVIEERVNWLLNQQAEPKIWVVSFTRASSRELKARISRYLAAHEHEVTNIPVTTLHSLALSLLRKAKRLNFSSDPRVLDNWELEEILDKEFWKTSGIATVKRCAEIRRDFEATCNTDQISPPNYQEAAPPITNEERHAFNVFHKTFTLTYSCVLPGEIVRLCVKELRSGVMSVKQHLDIDHFIIDEYQDLNPVDLMFTDHIAESGTNSFVAGDDDQSIYAFRYASPKGIQEYLDRFPNAVSHSLVDCFRCSPKILQTAVGLIENNALPNRVNKSLESVYTGSPPFIGGLVKRWIFKSGSAEARAIAISCKRLIDVGLRPRDIMILLSNTGVLLPDLKKSFKEIDLPLDLPKQGSFIDTDAGRLAYSIIRIACDSNLEDYLAHRTLLNLLQGVGLTTCNAIRLKVIENNLNYLEVFYHQLPEDVFSTREINAIRRASEIFMSVREWSGEDTISERADISQLILKCSDNKKPSWAEEWTQAVDPLPEELNLGELLQYFTADNDEQRAVVLKEAYERIGLQIPDDEFLSQSIRVMTMHSAKGLDAEVVFIPGLEKGLIPNRKIENKPGLVLEAARLLYVAVTRAKAACVLSYAESRVIYGDYTDTEASDFVSDLGGYFVKDSKGLTAEEAQEIKITIDNMHEVVQP